MRDERICICTSASQGAPHSVAFCSSGRKPSWYFNLTYRSVAISAKPQCANLSRSTFLERAARSERVSSEMPDSSVVGLLLCDGCAGHRRDWGHGQAFDEAR